jgi:hypothetical protein
MIREEILPPEHPHTVLARVWLARSLVAQGRPEEARPLYEQVLAGPQESLAAIDPQAVRAELEDLG